MFQGNGSMNVDNPFDDVTGGQNFDNLGIDENHLNEESHDNDDLNFEQVTNIYFFWNVKFTL